MNPFHIQQQPDGRWRILEGNAIIWGECALKQHAQRIADALGLFIPNVSKGDVKNAVSTAHTIRDFVQRNLASVTDGDFTKMDAAIAVTILSEWKEREAAYGRLYDFVKEFWQCSGKGEINLAHFDKWARELMEPAREPEKYS